MAHIAVGKYADHLPLYRQEGIYTRLGVELSRSTMCDWMAVAAGLLQPVVKAMLKRVLQSQVVQTDDTPVKVQDHAGKGIKTGRLWVQIGDHNHRYTVYDYTPDRGGDGPRRVFQDFNGYLQADAYSGYDALFIGGKIVEVGCWMHAVALDVGVDRRALRDRGSREEGTQKGPRVGRRRMACASLCLAFAKVESDLRRDPCVALDRAMAGMLAIFAEFEREILRERVRAGIAQGRKEGRPHGRPRTASLKFDEVKRMKLEGLSHSEIARRLKIGRTSVRRILAAN